MPQHIGRQDQCTASRCGFASRVARSWSAAQKTLADRQRPLEKSAIEQSASALVSALMIGILVGAALRSTHRTGGPDRPRRPA